MVHLVGIGGREFSVGRLAGCRSPFTESTLTALGLSQPAVVYTCTNLKMQTHGKHEKICPPSSTRNPQHPGDRDHLETTRDETRPTCYPILARFHRSFVEIGLVQLSQSVKRRMLHIQTDRQTDRQRD